MIEFQAPLAFLLLPLPLAAYLLLPPHRKRVQALRFPFFRQLAEALNETPKPGSLVWRRKKLQVLAAVVVWGLLVAALAQPVRIGEPVIEEKPARDVMLAIDISGSMDQVDFGSASGDALQRLDAVKQVVGRFIADRRGDRVALIVFGTRAYIQAPFTEDLASVGALLDQTEVGMAGPHTALGDAIGLAIKTFQASQFEDKLLLILSDGADTSSRMTPVNAAAIAASEGIEIIAIGVGDPEGSGEQRLDETELRTIAATANGTYFFAGNEQALSDIYSRIDALKPRTVDTASYRPRDFLGHYLSALAFFVGCFALLVLVAANQYRRAR